MWNDWHPMWELLGTSGPKEGAVGEVGENTVKTETRGGR
jgi:hypothetical protein